VFIPKVVNKLADDTCISNIEKKKSIQDAFYILMFGKTHKNIDISLLKMVR